MKLEKKITKIKEFLSENEITVTDLLEVAISGDEDLRKQEEELEAQKKSLVGRCFRIEGTYYKVISNEAPNDMMVTCLEMHVASWYDSLYDSGHIELCNKPDTSAQYVEHLLSDCEEISPEQFENVAVSWARKVCALEVEND